MRSSCVCSSTAGRLSCRSAVACCYKRAPDRSWRRSHSAATDTVGDAHEGHGSYCTPGHIEIQRASCWLTTGNPTKAIILYEDALRSLPPVYQRNRAAALSRLAVAYLADGQLEQAASTAHAALPVARSSGAKRIVDEIKCVSAELAPHRPSNPSQPCWTIYAARTLSRYQSSSTRPSFTSSTTSPHTPSSSEEALPNFRTCLSGHKVRGSHRPGRNSQRSQPASGEKASQ